MPTYLHEETVAALQDQIRPEVDRVALPTSLPQRAYDELAEALTRLGGDLRIGGDVHAVFFPEPLDPRLLHAALLLSREMPPKSQTDMASTPADVIARMLELADFAAGPKQLGCLEPSAGWGVLADAMKAEIDRTEHTGYVSVVEQEAVRAAYLFKRGYLMARTPANFLTWTGSGNYHRILLHPPTTRRDQDGKPIQDIWLSHISHAETMLAPGGRLVAVIPDLWREGAKLTTPVKRFKLTRVETDGYHEPLPALRLPGQAVSHLCLIVLERPGPRKAWLTIPGTTELRCTDDPAKSIARHMGMRVKVVYEPPSENAFAIPFTWGGKRYSVAKHGVTIEELEAPKLVLPPPPPAEPVAEPGAAEPDPDEAPPAPEDTYEAWAPHPSSRGKWMLHRWYARPRKKAKLRYVSGCTSATQSQPVMVPPAEITPKHTYCPTCRTAPEPPQDA